MRKIFLVAMNLPTQRVSPTTNLLVEIAAGFRANGCACDIVELVAKEDRSRVNPHAFVSLIQASGTSAVTYSFALFRSVFLFSRLLKKDGGSAPGVFIISVYPGYLFLLTLVSRLRKVPVIAYLYEEWISLLLYDDVPLVRRALACVRQVPASLFLYGVCFRLTDGVAVIVDELRGFLVGRFGINPEKIYLFPNVVTAMPDRGTALLARPHLERPYVVFAGGLSFSKDAISRILKAMRILKDRKVDIELRFYGGIDEARTRRLKGEMAEAGVSDRVRLMGYVSRERLDSDVAGACASLVIKRSVPFNRYNFPTKMMDALRLKVPLILSNATLFRRYFSDKVSACLVDPESELEIAEAIGYLLAQPEQGRVMAEKAARLLSDEFNGAKVCCGFLAKFGGAEGGR